MQLSSIQKQTNVNIQEKANLIWESATHLVGLFKPHEYGKVILPMTVLKRFDDALAPTKQAVLEMKKKLDATGANEQLIEGALTRTSGYAFYNTSKFDFQKLLADPDNIADNFDDYLKGFSANVADIISRFEFANTVGTMVEGGVLFVMIQEFNSAKADEEYASDPYRAVNFRTDESGNLICPNNRKMQFAYRAAVKGNHYGRQEEVYTCEDCRGCPYAERCKKGEGNRTVRLNQELTQIHEEVLENLNCIHGALLRRNRSIQAEGTFGIMKQDRNYRRTRRRSLDFVRTELYLVSIGHNLYKYCNKLQKQQIAA